MTVGFWIGLALAQMCKAILPLDFCSLVEAKPKERCMKVFKICHAFIAMSLSFAGPTWASESLSPDMPTQVNGIDVVCTGVSLDARQDPRWSTYALKIEFAGPGGQYIGDEVVSVRHGDTEILNVS